MLQSLGSGPRPPRKSPLGEHKSDIGKVLSLSIQWLATATNLGSNDSTHKTADVPNPENNPSIPIYVHADSPQPLTSTFFNYSIANKEEIIENITPLLSGNP